MEDHLLYIPKPDQIGYIFLPVRFHIGGNDPEDGVLHLPSVLCRFYGKYEMGARIRYLPIEADGNRVQKSL